MAGSLARQFMFVAVVSAVTIGWAGWLLRSPWGRALKAVRDDEWAAQSLRKDALRLHLEAAWVASMLASIAGAHYAMYVSYIDPLLASLDSAILVLSMTIIGGAGNLRGPIVGALLLVLLPELLKQLALPTSKLDSVRLLVYGAALTLFVHVRPQGIAGVYRAS
jgi:branched-chain amino acid transport system permease protein